MRGKITNMVSKDLEGGCHGLMDFFGKIQANESSWVGTHTYAVK
jgi:hypothetical protein